MPFAIRLIETADIPNAVAVINKSSRGHSFELQLDGTKFLALSSFWNFSYRHSYIAFTDQGEPAGVVVNSVDPDTRETYSYYWGVMPQFRGTHLGIRLATTYLDQVARDDFSTAHAEASADSPNAIYRRLGFDVAQVAIEMECPGSGFEDGRPLSELPVRRLELNEFLHASAGFRKQPLCWIQRPGSLRNAARFLRFVCCDTASAACRVGPDETMIIDLQFDPADKRAATALISYLVCEAIPHGCKISSIQTNSALHTLLLELGFVVVKRATCLTLDLDRWRARTLKGASSA
jgi:hypothetical protein